MQSSLTLPGERDTKQSSTLDPKAPPLSDEETITAVNELYIVNKTNSFLKVERRYADPPVDGQKFCLVSFVPANGATPNKDGLYGMAKVRGCYDTQEETDQRANFIIQNVDSYHKIFHTYVGRPYPITVSSDYSRDVSEVQFKKDVAETYASDLKKKREKEQKEIQEMKEREEELLKDVQKEKEDDDDRYTTLKVKKAQLSWTYLETEKKLQQMCGSIAKTQKELEEMDAQNPEFAKIYYEKYVQARKKSNLDMKMENDSSFMKYLVEDIRIPAVEKEYELLFGSLENAPKSTSL